MHMLCRPQFYAYKHKWPIKFVLCAMIILKMKYWYRSIIGIRMQQLMSHLF